MSAIFSAGDVLVWKVTEAWACAVHPIMSQV